MSGYAIKLGGHTFTPNVKDDTIKDVDAHNKALERRELAAWAAKPDRWSVYITTQPNPSDNGHPMPVATTWLGTLLSAGRVWQMPIRNAFARNVRAVRFLATNGAEYYGRYGADSSQLCNVRRVKGT